MTKIFAGKTFSKRARLALKVKRFAVSTAFQTPITTFWKSKYGDMSASDLKRKKEMEQELSQLKRMYADMVLENRALKDLIEKKL